MSASRCLLEINRFSQNTIVILEDIIGVWPSSSVAKRIAIAAIDAFAGINEPRLWNLNEMLRFVTVVCRVLTSICFWYFNRLFVLQMFMYNIPFCSERFGESSEVHFKVLHYFCQKIISEEVQNSCSYSKWCCILLLKYINKFNFNASFCWNFKFFEYWTTFLLSTDLYKTFY